MRLRKNINPITIGIGKKGIQRVLEPIFFVGLFIWMAKILIYALGPEIQIISSPLDRELINSIWAKLIGAMLIVTGFIIFISALISFRDSWRVGIDTQSPGRLVTTGIFAITRNPIYIFIDLYFIGTFLINGTLIFLIFSLLAAASTHYQIIQEERFLARNYGKEYEDYCARTPRYFRWRKRYTDQCSHL